MVLLRPTQTLKEDRRQTSSSLNVKDRERLKMVAISSNLFLVSALERLMDLREANFKEEPVGFLPVRFQIAGLSFWFLAVQPTAQ